MPLAFPHLPITVVGVAYWCHDLSFIENCSIKSAKLHEYCELLIHRTDYTCYKEKICACKAPDTRVLWKKLQKATGQDKGFKGPPKKLCPECWNITLQIGIKWRKAYECQSNCLGILCMQFNVIFTNTQEILLSSLTIKSSSIFIALPTDPKSTDESLLLLNNFTVVKNEFCHNHK